MSSMPSGSSVSLGLALCPPAGGTRAHWIINHHQTIAVHAEYQAGLGLGLDCGAPDGSWCKVVLCSISGLRQGIFDQVHCTSVAAAAAAQGQESGGQGPLCAIHTMQHVAWPTSCTGQHLHLQGCHNTHYKCTPSAWTAPG